MSKNVKQTKRPYRGKQKRKSMSDRDLKLTGPTSNKMVNNGLSHNDPDWYIYDQTMFDGTISMPTFEVKGKLSIPVQTMEVKGPWNVDGPTYRLPNVLGYAMNPSPGWSPDAQSPINLMSRKMYAELSASNAKTSNYAPEDIAMCILSLGQIVSSIENLKRAYGVANHFNFFNRSIPETILAAQGFDYDSIRMNLSDFRAMINQLIARVDTIQFPANIPYFKQCDYIYKNVFVDRDDKMPTYHFMYPNTSWILDEKTYDTGSALVEVDFNELDASYTDIVNKVNGMIDAVLTSATFNYIFADVVNLINRNVFSSETIHIDMLPIDYAIAPLYSEQFNWQIMNMTVLGNPTTESIPSHTLGNKVFCNTDGAYIEYAPAFIAPEAVVDIPHPIRLPDINISSTELVECLAYYAPWIVNKSGDNWYKEPSAIPTFYCANVNVYRSTDTGELDNVLIPTNNNTLNYWTTGGNPLLGYITEPIHTPYFGGIIATNNTRRAVPLCKIGAFTQIMSHPMDNLRYQAILGLFKYK